MRPLHSWAFSAVGAMEGQHARKTGQLVSLSEQNLVDCSHNGVNRGCSGGLPFLAFQYVISNRGIDTEQSYPYTAREGQCAFRPQAVGATFTSFQMVGPQGSESALQAAVANVGPISVGIDASKAFQHYTTGLFDDPSCTVDRVDHGVTVVGYGTYQGQPYWKVKNSWGVGWGEQGYILMSRNKRNQCGIASYASYPIV